LTAVVWVLPAAEMLVASLVAAITVTRAVVAAAVKLVTITVERLSAGAVAVPAVSLRVVATLAVSLYVVATMAVSLCVVAILAVSVCAVAGGARARLVATAVGWRNDRGGADLSVWTPVWGAGLGTAASPSVVGAGGLLSAATVRGVDDTRAAGASRINAALAVGAASGPSATAAVVPPIAGMLGIVGAGPSTGTAAALVSGVGLAAATTAGGLANG
jgi:hypothetical protein